LQDFGCLANYWIFIQNKELLPTGISFPNIITYTYSFDCKETKRSNKTKFNYPYTLILKYPIKTAAIPFKQAA
jgi:hypothetical protein